MKIRIPLLSMLFVLLCAFAAEAQEPLDDIRSRMKQRFKALQDLKIAGKVGETQQGWLEAIHGENAKDPAIKKIVDAENEDREKLYKIIAKRTETTPKAVGEQNALRIFKKAKPNEMFKGPDGKWRPKKLIDKKKPGPK